MQKRSSSSELQCLISVLLFWHSVNFQLKKGVCYLKYFIPIVFSKEVMAFPSSIGRQWDTVSTKAQRYSMRDKLQVLGNGSLEML